MGYTHYWRQYKHIPEITWGAIAHDVKRLLAAMPATVDDPNGYYSGPQPLFLTGTPEEKLVPPEITDKMIYFNGCDANGNDNEMGHETFLLHRRAYKTHQYDSRHNDGDGTDTQPYYFRFCKTAGKPYDLMVCAVLLVVHFHTDNTREYWERNPSKKGVNWLQNQYIAVRSDGTCKDWLPAIRFVGETLGKKYVESLPVNIDPWAQIARAEARFKKPSDDDLKYYGREKLAQYVVEYEDERDRYLLTLSLLPDLPVTDPWALPDTTLAPSLVTPDTATGLEPELGSK